jgi:hypothetical protein
MLKGLGAVSANLDAWALKKKIAVAAYGQMVAAPKLQAYARANAPWNDISGQARAGLKGSSSTRGNKVMVTLAHSMSYGPYLELCNDGNYAILDPTINALKAEIFGGYRRIMMM